MQLSDNVFYNRFVFFQVRNERKKQKTALDIAANHGFRMLFSEMKLKKNPDGLYYGIKS